METRKWQNSDHHSSDYLPGILVGAAGIPDEIGTMKFIIDTSEFGNPLPKARFTGRQMHTDKAQRYHEYLDDVRMQFIEQCYLAKSITAKEKFDMQHFSLIDRKPLHTGDRKCHMKIFITWHNHNHGDPENIFGAIADALFEQDKYLTGSFDFDPYPIDGGGQVVVEISIGDKIPTKK